MSDGVDSVTEAGGPVLATDEGDLLGAEIGGYVVDDVLGKGGVGIVYAATHSVIGKRVAIKVLRPAMSDNATTVERFVQEARSVNRIGHPNIVDIFAFGTLPDGRHYFVMDLLEGESLRARVRRGALPPREALQIIDEIAAALIAAHDKGFIHRDLKPDNVFLVAHPGRVDIKLLDFGLAKLKGDLTRAYRTATGARVGTPDYMSPEQLRGSRDVDERTDVFALGVMTCELLAGTRPQRVGEATFERPIIDVVGAVAGLPRQLVSLVAAMTATERDARPALAKVRATITELAPILARANANAAPPRRPIVTADMSLSSLTASMVGAKPVLATPQAGVPAVGPPTPEAASSSGVHTSGLRSDGSHSGTRLGVPPPPVQTASRLSRPHSVATPLPPRERKRWLFIAIALAMVAAAALALVLVLVK